MSFVGVVTAVTCASIGAVLSHPVHPVEYDVIALMVDAEHVLIVMIFIDGVSVVAKVIGAIAEPSALHAVPVVKPYTHQFPQSKL